MECNILKKLILCSAVAASFNVCSVELDSYDLLTEQSKQLNSVQTKARHKVLTEKSSPLLNNSKKQFLHPVFNTPTFISASPNIPAFDPKTPYSALRHSKNSTAKTKLNIRRQASEYYLAHYQDLLVGKGNKHNLAFDSATTNNLASTHTIRYKQMHLGKEVLGNGVVMLLNKDLELTAINSRLVPVSNLTKAKQVATKSSQTQAFSQAAQIAAVQAALNAIVKATPATSALEPSKLTLQYKLVGDLAGWVSNKPIYVEEFFYPQLNQFIPAYRVSARLSKKGEHSRHMGIVVSAENGEILQIKNYSRKLQHNSATDHQYRVFADPSTGAPQDGPNGNNGSPHPTGQLDGYIAPLAKPNLITLSAIGNNKPWLPVNAEFSKGNNVDAYLDLSFPDGFSEGDLRAPVSNNSLDYHFDATVNADANLQQQYAAVTNLFYTINYLHDVYYLAGFDEVSGNAQLDNFGLGGKQGDPILAEGQDYSGVNNANMFTPPDGQSPVMQQYLFKAENSLQHDLQIGGNKLDLSMTSLGAPFFKLNQLSAAELKSKDNQANICAPVINANELVGKLVFVQYIGSCNEQELLEQLQSITPAALVFAQTELSEGFLPFQLEQSLPYPILSTFAYESDPISYQQIQQAIEQDSLTVSVAFEDTFVTDSTMSNLVIMHEFGHYLHERLAGNGEGLGFNAYAAALGEGIGDFNALLHQVREEDLNKNGGHQYQGVYAQGGWVDAYQSEEPYYFGIRRVPYSINREKNNLSYKHVEPGQALPTEHPIARGLTHVSEQLIPHEGGEVWASILFDGFINLVRENDQPLEQVKAKMRRYLVNGLKLTPTNPTFLTARDALLAAVLAESKEDAKVILRAFAARGMGTQASGSSDNFSDITESYSTKESAFVDKVELVKLSGQCDNDNIWDQGEAVELNVSIKNTGIENIETGNFSIYSDNASIKAEQITFNNLAELSSLNATAKIELEKFEQVHQPVNIYFKNIESEQVISKFQLTANYDIRSGNLETFSLPFKADFQDLSQRFLNWDVASLVEFENPKDTAIMTWHKDLSTDNQKARILPFIADSNLDTVMVSKPFKVSADKDLIIEFNHAFVGYAGRTGGLVEIKPQGQDWQAASDLQIKQYNSAGNVTQGYGGKMASFGSPLDGVSAFSGTNQTEQGVLNSDFIFHKTQVNFAQDYSGQTVQIRFRYFDFWESRPVDLGYADIYWGIDDITISGVDGTVFRSVVAENSKVCQLNTPPQVTLSSSFGSNNNGVLKIKANAGDTIAIKATASDADKDELSYQWQQTSGQDLTIHQLGSGSIGVAIAKTAKNGSANLVLKVSDGQAEVEVKAELTIVENKKSGGGIGFLLFGLLAFSAYRRGLIR